jgi:hypothetical protein
MRRVVKAVLCAGVLAVGLYTTQVNAQPPSGACERGCLTTYVATVQACAGNPACLALARAAAAACVRACFAQ